jgi:peptidoglycan/LPS O-acetylase OafA/YrhL
VAAVIGVVLLTGIAIGHALFSQVQTDWCWAALLRALPEFAAGILAYRAYRERLFAALWEKDATFVVIVAMVIGGCFVGASDGVIVLLLLPLLLAAVCNCGRMAGILNTGPLRWLGEISYSVYIFQALPLMLAVGFSGRLVAHGLGGSWFTGLAALLALGSGVLVHRCVDLPVRAALRRLPDRVMALSAAHRGTETRPVLLVPVSVLERDR